MSIPFLIIIGIILWVVLHRTVTRRHEKVICRNCGTMAYAKTVSPRSLLVEIILWFSYLVPGVIYTLWCHHHTYDVCDKCGSRDIVPLDSPVGRKLAGQSAVDALPISQQTGLK